MPTSVEPLWSAFATVKATLPEPFEPFSSTFSQPFFFSLSSCLPLCSLSFLPWWSPVVVVVPEVVVPEVVPSPARVGAASASAAARPASPTSTSINLSFISRLPFFGVSLEDVGARPYLRRAPKVHPFG